MALKTLIRFKMQNITDNFPRCKPQNESQNFLLTFKSQKSAKY